MTEVTKIQDVTPAETTLPAAQDDPMMALIEKVILTPDLPMERIEAALNIRERQIDKSAEQAFNAAFAASMADMPDVPRSGYNKHLKRSYSTLDDLIRASRPVLSKHGLSLNWQTGIDGDQIWVKAIVRHASGHSISTEQSAPRDKSGSMNQLQGGGSTETYLKRYTGFAILGLASGDEADDDGQAEGVKVDAEELRWIESALEALSLKPGVICDAERIIALHDLPQSRFPHVKQQLFVTAKKRGIKL